MSRKMRYLIAKIRNVFWVGLRRICRKTNLRFSRKTYYGEKIGDYEKANQLIYDGIMSDRPFMAARFGDTELRATVYALENQLGLRTGFPEYIKQKMNVNAGFFPADDEHLRRFGELMMDSVKQVDVFGVWYNLLEDYMIHEFSPKAKCVHLEGLEPYRVRNPWSAALKGKRVLVIHPFEESIRKQYEKRELLFEDKNVLPEFELVTLKAVQTLSVSDSEFEDWFAALDYMYTEAMKKDFDVAIIGCGAYGLPLAAKLKTAGKTVIHLGGATQMLFGIIGARWEAKPETVKLINEHWSRPMQSERPKAAESVEGGCYW